MRLALLLVMLLAGCGETTLSGDAPEQPGSQPPLTLTPSGTRKVHVMSGRIETPIFIGEGERLVLLPTELPDGTPVEPTFTHRVIVAPDGRIAGAGRFLGGLETNGSRDRPVLWEADAGQTSVIVDPQLRWLVATGGTFRLQTETAGRILDTSFSLGRVWIAGKARSLLDIYWSRFDAVDVTVDVREGGADAQRLPRTRIIGAAFQEAPLVPLGFSRLGDILEIEGANFGRLRAGQVYFDRPTDASDLLLDERLLGGNYFTNPRVLLRPQSSLVTFASWLSLPLLAGPGASEPSIGLPDPATTVAVTTEGPAFTLRRNAAGAVAATSALVKATLAAIGNEDLKDRFVPVASSPSLTLTLTYGAPEGCTALADDADTDSGTPYVCDGPVVVPVKLSATTPGTTQTVERRLSLAFLTAEHVYAEARVAALDAMNELVRRGALRAVPARIPDL